MPTAYSILAGADIDTSSEQWRHECECRWLLKTKKTRVDKHRYLYGVDDRAMLFELDSKTFQQVLRDDHAKLWQRTPLMKYRGLEATDRILADARTIHEQGAKAS